MAKKIAILGASGYTGAELVRILVRHKGFEIVAMTGDRKAGQVYGEVFPHLGGLDLPRLCSIDQLKWDDIEAVLCALPHGTTQEIVASIPKHIKVVDLSADFRFADPEEYAANYGHAHKAAELQKEVVYGLREIERAAIKKARVVANPGCYPTAAQLALIPLLEAKLISPEDIVIDAKSGVSGAGRAAKEASLYCEVAGGIHAYGIATHRHAPEIDQGLSKAAGTKLMVNFTPHLMPMSRGILDTIYVKLSPHIGVQDLRVALTKKYAEEYFVKVLPEGMVAATRHVTGSNFCLISVHPDRVPGRAIICAVIDNLVKGASGQAVQNLNILCGYPEETALEQQPLFP